MSSNCYRNYLDKISLVYYYNNSKNKSYKFLKKANSDIININTNFKNQVNQ